MWLLWHSVAHRIKWFSHFFASVLWSFSLQQTVWLIQLSNEMPKIRTGLGDTKLNVIDDRDNEIMNGNGCAVRDAMDILLMAVSFRWWFVVCCWEPAPLYLAHATLAMTITNDLKSHSGKERNFLFLISQYFDQINAIGDSDAEMSFLEWWLIYNCMRRGGMKTRLDTKSQQQNSHSTKHNPYQFNSMPKPMELSHSNASHQPIANSVVIVMNP